jgi:hypothetical protein
VSEGINVDVNELRASAAAVRAIAEDLQQPMTTAVQSCSTAAGQLAGWEVGTSLQLLSTQWSPVLAGVRAKLEDTATELDGTAQGHEWTDHAIWQLMRGGQPR